MMASLLDATWQDFRHGTRALLRVPGFTLTAVITLALGIGANTAIFTVVQTVLLRPLPYRDASRLYMVWSHPNNAPDQRSPASLPNIKDWQAQTSRFEGIAAWAFNRYVMSGREGIDHTRAAQVTPSFFDVLGVAPLHGRVLGAPDDRERMAVLGHALWQRRYGGDPHVIGRTLHLNDQPYSIVGVMPRAFRFPQPDIELWVSFGDIYAVATNPTIGDWINDRGLRGYRVVARMAADVQAEEAQAEIRGVAARLAEEYPDTNGGWSVTLIPVREQVIGNVQPALLVLLGAVACVLFIACANVASLTMGRAAARRGELAVRRALGAGAGRLARQLFTESLLVALAGGAAGLVVASWLLHAAVSLVPEEIPRLDEVGIDRTVLAFALIVCVMAAFVTMLMPWLAERRAAPDEVLRQTGPRTAGNRGHRARRVFVIGEVALAVVLVTAAGLMTRSFARLMAVDVGFASDEVLTASVPLMLHHYPEPGQQVGYYERVLEAVRALPGVRAAGAATSLPPTLLQMGTSFTIEGRAVPPRGQELTAWFMPATPGFHEALGLPLVAGRRIDGRDHAHAPRIAIVNRALAVRYFAGEQPIGQRIQVEGETRTIVGVVGDTYYEGLRQPPSPQLYVPYAQRPFPGLHIAVRTAGDPETMMAAVRRAIVSVDPRQAPRRIVSMAELIGESVAEPRFHTLLLGSFGMLGLLLAVVGLYGLLVYDVTERRREIGIRLALGASPRDVTRHVVWSGLALAVTGAILGIGGALAATRLMRGLLFDTAPYDPLTLAGAVIVMLVTAALASYLPARRAARTNPAETLQTS